MIAKVFDSVIETLAPNIALRRKHARTQLERAYASARPDRLNARSNPQNRSADQENREPYGADAVRKWARMLVRDNAYASGVVDTIVSSVVGRGIVVQHVSEDESLNERRDKTWKQWTRQCDVNGQLSFAELQRLCQREMAEGGECFVHVVPVDRQHKGVRRPVPMALELIEADRLAIEMDTIRPLEDGSRIERGILIDADGQPQVYYVYKAHPDQQISVRSEVIPIPANRMIHLYRRDRIGQSRGVSWFAPAIEWLRSLGTYLDNELQASAIAACFTAAIETDGPFSSVLSTPSAEDSEDADSNTYDWIQPGLIMHLAKGEKISFGHPGSGASENEPWISLMLRGIAVGTGLSYETVARDYSKTNYSSNRASQLEDRRRFRVWQDYLVTRLTERVHWEFCIAAAMIEHPDFPDMTELLTEGPDACPAEHQSTGWEWVDPMKEEMASERAIKANLSTLRDELGQKGKNWKHVMRQRRAEELFAEELGLGTSASGEDVASSTLNGSQILAAIEILAGVANDSVAEDAAVALLMTLGLTKDVAEEVVQAQANEAEPPPAPVAPPQFNQPPGTNNADAESEAPTERSEAALA